MPMGEWVIAGGTAVFLWIKFAGYWAAGGVMNGRYKTLAPANPWLFAAVRTLLGLIVSGGATYLLGSAIDGPRLQPFFYGYLLVLPLRFLQWVFVIWLFYARRDADLRLLRLLGYSLGGTVWTLVLDMPVFFLAIGAFAGFC